jgi:hypothetical protein
MQRFVRFLGTAAVIVALSACSGLIPPLTVTNLFGLDGTVVELERESVMTSSDGGSLSTTFAGLFAAQLVSEGIDLPDLVLGLVNAQTLSETIRLDTEVDVRVPEGHEPDLTDFAIESASLSLTVSDGTTLLATASATATFSPALVVAKVDCDGPSEGFVMCAYTLQAGGQVPGVALTVSGAQAAAVFNAIKDGTTLDVAGTATLTLGEPGLSSAAVIVVRLVAPQGSGTITF